MASYLVTLKCLTNMHVGNGDVNYNIVDNEVEVDPVTGYPTINASGVKGALRNYFKDNKRVIDWFGSESGNQNNHKQGAIKFLAANILARPLRASDGKAAYHLVYTEDMINQYKNLCDAFEIETNINKEDCKDKYEVEGEEITEPINIDGNVIYKISNINKYRLPVVARNNIDSNTGISQNLWYEEIVPHESIFYFFITSENKELLDELKNSLDGQVVQFGANATIGYGLCKVTVR